MSGLFCIRNLTESNVAQAWPWEYTGSHPPRKEWESPETNYLHYSGFEAMVPQKRVTRETNPAAAIHALVADFDATITPEMLVKATGAAKIMPNWTSQTSGGGARFVWLLSEPVPVMPGKLLGAFLTLAAKRLGLARLLPGWDKDAWENGAMYYACGTAWTRAATGPVSADTVAGWMAEAGAKFNWRKTDGIVIPVDDVRAEAEARWPDGWGGQWSIGSRGRVFWEPSSGNPRAAVLRETGMQCFSGSKPFFSWRDIFGAGFVEKYEADRLGAATRDTYFDGEHYWSSDDGTKWEKIKRIDLQMELRVRGLNGEKGRHDTASEVDRAMSHINRNCRIDSAGNYVYFPQGLQTIGRLRVLNCSRVAPVTAAAHSGDWGAGFPILAAWFDALFAEPIQLDYFMAWLRRFYGSAARRKPEKGLSLIIAGPVGRGKTFLSDCVLSTLMGGHYDGSEHLVDGGSFSNGCYDYGLWTVGDARPAQDWKSRTQYTARLKKLVANRTFLANEKYEKAYMTHWLGRILITCNDDPVSIQMLPDLDQSISDKVSFLRIAEKSAPVFAEAEAVLEDELPQFAGWLVASRDVPEIVQDTRFGQVPYQDEFMRETVNGASQITLFEELIHNNIEDIADGKPEWTGPASQLFRQLAGADTAGTRDHSAVSVGRLMSQLLAQGRPYLGYKRHPRMREYRISVIDLKTYFSAQPTEDKEDAPF